MHLVKYGGVFHMDASVRLVHNNMTKIFETAFLSNGFVALTGSSTNIFQTTRPVKYNYLPINISKTKEENMFQAGTLVIYNTKSVYDNIMLWWVLCSLEQFCVAPFPVSNDCKCNKKDITQYCGCDRFDQSVVNILAYNHYGFDGKMFKYRESRKDSILTVERRITNQFKVHFCRLP